VLIILFGLIVVQAGSNKAPASSDSVVQATTANVGLK
jgi:hypothetical protein